MMNFKFLSKEEFDPLFKHYRPIVFSDSATVDLDGLYSESENAKTKKLNELCTIEYRLYLTVWDDNKLVGWSFGYQKSGTEFYMCNSAVLSEYRKLGHYTKLMNTIIEKAQNDGFKEITSKHHADNNAVIIPKLKAGFVIRGFEIDPRFGLMVNLVKYSSPALLLVHHQRTGLKKGDIR